MALAVTIFGLAERSSSGILVYAYLRTNRGSGDYPPPISSRAPLDPVSRRTIDGMELEVVIWDKTFTDTESAAVLSGLQASRLTIPAESPIEPKVLIGSLSEPLDAFVFLGVGGIVFSVLWNLRSEGMR